MPAEFMAAIICSRATGRVCDQSDARPPSGARGYRCVSGEMTCGWMSMTPFIPPRGPEQPEPRFERIARQRLGDRRHVGQEMRALGRGDTEEPDARVLGERH